MRVFEGTSLGHLGFCVGYMGDGSSFLQPCVGYTQTLGV